MVNILWFKGCSELNIRLGFGCLADPKVIFKQLKSCCMGVGARLDLPAVTVKLVLQSE